MSNILRANKGGITGFPGKFKMETRIVPGSVITPLLLFNVRNPVDKYNYGPTLAGEDAVFVEEYEDQVPYHGPGTNYVIPSKAGILLVNPDTTDVEIIKPDFSDSIHDTIFPQSGPRISNVSVDEENEVIVIDTSAVGFVTDFEFNLLEVLDYSDGYKTAVYLDGNRYYLYGIGRIPPQRPTSFSFANIIDAHITPYGDVVVIEELDTPLNILYAIHVLDADGFLSATSTLPSGYENVDVSPFIIHTHYSENLGIAGPVESPVNGGYGREAPFFTLIEGNQPAGITGDISGEAYENILLIDYLSNGDMIVADQEQYNDPVHGFPGNHALFMLPRISRISLRTGKVKWRQYATPEHVPGEQENYYSISGLFVDEQDNIVCSLIPIPINPDDVKQLLVLNADGEQLHRQSLDVTNLTIGEKPKRLNKLGFRITFHPHPVLPLPNAVGVATWKASQHEDHHEYVIYLNEQEIARTQALTKQIEDIELGGVYTFKIVSVSQTGEELITFEFTDSAEVLPPSLITNLSSSFENGEFDPSYENGEINLSWEDPMQGSTASINIYQDGSLIAKVDPGVEEYNIYGLNQFVEAQIELRVENEVGVVGGAIRREDTPWLTFIEDFSNSPLGGGLPNDWTIRNSHKNVGTEQNPDYQPTDFNLQVVADTSGQTEGNSKVLRLTPGADDTAILSWNKLDGYKYVEWEIKWRPAEPPQLGLNVGMLGGFGGGILPSPPYPDAGTAGIQAGWRSGIGSNPRKYVTGSVSTSRIYGNDWQITVIRSDEEIDEFDGQTRFTRVGFHEKKRQWAEFEPRFRTINRLFSEITGNNLITTLELTAEGTSGPGKVLGVDYNAIDIDYIKARVLKA